MLLVIGAFVTLTVVVVSVQLRSWWDGNLERLGSMSQQWLTEYRESHPS
jgi:hypothetical protein